MIPGTFLQFADAGSDYASAVYTILGVPYDGTTSFRPGTRNGPKVVRELSWNFESWMEDIESDFSEIPFHDCGDLETGVVACEVVAEVRQAVGDLIRSGKVPVLIGGEHSITIGAVQAVIPDWFVVCDAHLDLREEFRGTPCNHACTTRQVIEGGVRNVVIIGARSGTADQYRYARDTVSLYSADRVREIGISHVIREIRDCIGDARVYLSIDADVIDCCLTPGVGTPEPFGLSPLEIREVIRALAAQTVAFDYVEVCDSDNGQTAAVAVQLIREFIGRHWLSRIRTDPALSAR